MRWLILKTKNVFLFYIITSSGSISKLERRWFWWCTSLSFVYNWVNTNIIYEKLHQRKETSSKDINLWKILHVYIFNRGKVEKFINFKIKV